MTAPSNSQIIEQYLKDRERIRLVRRVCESGTAGLSKEEAVLVLETLKNGGVQGVETYQSNRETYLLQQDDPTIMDFMTDLFLNGRDGKATAEAKKKDLGLKQNEIEKWLLKMLDKLKSKGIKTDFGTVYPTRKEGVSVADWDAFLEAEILRPAAEGLIAELDALGRDAGLLNVDDVLGLLREAAHLNFLNKAVNKTAVLERMGEKDEKDDSRPNPAPAGINYTAIRTVGVRAK